ncbi:MAG: hypothetical protein OEV08_02005, partial [Nitrospira sp.]|nr:hypothetical protein [Nitrospira sp.]
MKFLILNADYPDFLQWLYARHHDLAARPYAEQMRLRQESLYGVADFYSSNLRAIGHEAEDVYANNEWLQKTWAAEQGIAYDLTGAMSGTAVSVLERVKKAVRKMPMRPLTSYVRSWLPVRQALPTWLYDILRSQIERYKPDILLNQAVDAIPGQFIKKVKPYVRLIVGQHAATRLSESEDYGGYDLMISS